MYMYTFLVLVVVKVFIVIFRLPPNSFTSLYHDNTQESLVKGNLATLLYPVWYVLGNFCVFA